MASDPEASEAQDRLRDWRRFVIWRYDGSKKVPISPTTGRKIDPGDPAEWMDFETARREKLRRQSAAGIGFALDGTPFVLVDLDGCIRDGEITRFASRALSRLRGVEEVSVSRTGYHVLVQGEKPGSQCVGKGIEIYDSGRFVAIADESIVDKPIPERQEALTALYRATFPQGSLEDAAPAAEPPADDRMLLDKARECRKTGRAFAALYDHGSTSGYPSRSEAHNDLCRALAYWTAKDADRIERLFWQSALAGTVERADPKGYVRRTVRNALKRQTRSYTPGSSDGAKARVRELADTHAASLQSADLPDTDRRVLVQTIRHAGSWGYENEPGVLDFNLNQQQLADSLDMGQRRVSRSLLRLCEAGHLTRTSKGATGRNSFYRLYVEKVL